LMVVPLAVEDCSAPILERALRVCVCAVVRQCVVVRCLVWYASFVVARSHANRGGPPANLPNPCSMCPLSGDVSNTGPTTRQEMIYQMS
jgi:hypothetical protein